MYDKPLSLLSVSSQADVHTTTFPQHDGKAAFCPQTLLHLKDDFSKSNYIRKTLLCCVFSCGVYWGLHTPVNSMLMYLPVSTVHMPHTKTFPVMS